MINLAKKAYKLLTNCEIAVMSAMFIFLSFAIVVDVVGRKLFSFSFSWLEELSRYCFIICTFIGASVAVTRDEHPKMTAIQEFIGKKGAKALQILADVICIILFAFVFYNAVIQTANMANMGTMTTSLKIPLFLIVSIIPLSAFGMVIRYIFALVQKLRPAPDKPETPAEKGGEVL